MSASLSRHSSTSILRLLVIGCGWRPDHWLSRPTLSFVRSPTIPPFRPVHLTGWRAQRWSRVAGGQRRVSGGWPLTGASTAGHSAPLGRTRGIGQPTTSRRSSASSPEGSNSSYPRETTRSPFTFAVAVPGSRFSPRSDRSAATSGPKHRRCNVHSGLT